ncbi:TIGR03364 family FAD-dependent oxidoreductase [Kitasatospora aureofaciens]|uniref:TIGR03364 family FAD-dependent oxidoreductase n=1 Tax=Kitasatospora aureofaciens TaxID=1894 RepID=UPI001C451BB5|nr:TIGR03364 family FAD-dependent oxidoreductase [Kitasatospora aureofaciens]MBV6700195.1 TIGR03364 family FAD-dependent oxidoreductase [Kitasatospora aureofaciens]
MSSTTPSTAPATFAAPAASRPRTPGRSDVVIVGAGIIGLAHAFEALANGLSVTVVERDRQPVGASVRNFGHCCISAQEGELLSLAQRSRPGWLRAAEAAGLWAEEAGTLVVARSATEAAVLEELRADRGGDAVELRTAAQAAAALGRAAGDDRDLVGGAFLPADLRVNPREAAPGLARWVAEQPQGRILWGTAVTGIETGTVHTTRGPVHGERILVCVGHDLDYLFPDVAEDHEVQRCRLTMARAAAPAGFRTDAAVLTATSMLRYEAFTARPSAARLREEVMGHSPELLEIGANVMFTRLPDGTVLVGDSHHYDATTPPFIDEHTFELLTAAVAEILGVRRLQVLERWQGVYASSSRGPLLVRDLAPGVRAISVTSGIGMTLSFGLAAATFDGTLAATG